MHWGKDKFFVRSPKTERHCGKEGRFVPLWLPIRRELEALRSESEQTDKEDRVFFNRDASSNLRTRFITIQERAGIPMIPRFFDNCRASRSNEVFKKHGAFRESQWIGHSQAVAMQHYYQMLDGDYTTAVEEEPVEGENPADSEADE